MNENYEMDEGKEINRKYKNTKIITLYCIIVSVV